ncbi:GntR family transcriptional regulator [Fodinicola feengrottensis]|uniref:GntR family transcriptional regulator n=1 Tax=Fodinicola feengrottensis TaxID=435914 RepID=A0ABN2FWS6_9ACTN|nr:GntR family transcriptional regulator [Fodinicola feengrottensis]
MSALQVTSTTDALVAELRGQILGGQLRPGEPIPEIALAQRYEVARPTVRAALQTLVNRGLLVREHGRSARVPVLSVADVDDLYFMRTPLELLTVSTLAERGIDAMAADRMLARLAAMGPQASWAQRVQAHTDFHIALVDAVGSPRLSRLYAVVHEEMQLCLAQLQSTYPAPTALIDEHRQLLAAIRSGDPEVARTEMLAHMRRARDAFAATH